MGKRVDALLRIWALLWGTLLGYIFALIIWILGTMFMVIDVLWQVIAGSEGLDPNGTFGSFLQAVIDWSAGQRKFALTGNGEFRWHPWA